MTGRMLVYVWRGCMCIEATVKIPVVTILDVQNLEEMSYYLICCQSFIHANYLLHF